MADSRAMSNTSTNILSQAAAWAESGRKAALATVTRTWGSAPRPTGSQMAVREDGAFAGSVSGGCVEGAVIGAAQDSIADGKVRNLSFGVTNEDAWAVGLACGGTIEIRVAPISDSERETLSALAAARQSGRAAVLASPLNEIGSRVVFPGEPGTLGAAAAEAARRDQSSTVHVDGSDWFLTVFNPPLELTIIGAVHIAQPLADIARLSDYAVRVIDPRTGFASAERFPGVTLLHEWPDEALRAVPLTQRSAIVALTHDPKLDDPALAAALQSSAFYIGALGSKQTHARRLERLAAQGFTAEQLARIHGPVGLNIGARTPAEIAVSVLAEMTASLRQS